MKSPDVRLRKTERLEIYYLVQNAGFSPTELTWTDEDAFESAHSSHGGGMAFLASKIIHTASSYYCRFGGYFTEYSPGPNRRVEWSSFLDHTEGGWDSRLLACHTWLGGLRKEVDTPDLWELAKQDTSLVSLADSSIENTPFTDTERSDIKLKLDALRQEFIAIGKATHQFQAREFGLIEQRLLYLEDASGRWGRKDWLGLLFNSLYSLAMDLALNPGHAHRLWELAGSLFSGLAGFIG